METILITGGTGLVGKRLTQIFLEKGYQVIILTRSIHEHKSLPQNITYALWDVNLNKIDVLAIQKADYIIHLAGAGVVDKRWTEKYKKEIVDSRINSSRLLYDTLKNNTNKVKAFISSSAIGWYGPDKVSNHYFGEAEPANTDYLGETCRLWEESVDIISTLGIRVCKIRTGIVLSKEGGALSEFIKPIKLGMAAILGNGKQIISWIHIDDLCRIFLHTITNEKLSGSYNGVAPHPVSNKSLTITLAKLIKGNFFIPIHVPSFVLKIMMGESSIEVLKSTTVSAEKISNAGFVFNYPHIEAALKNLVTK